MQLSLTRLRCCGAGAGGALSPLYAVVLQGWRDVALAMLKDGGAAEDVNAPNKDGSTALFVASQKGLGAPKLRPASLENLLRSVWLSVSGVCWGRRGG